MCKQNFMFPEPWGSVLIGYVCVNRISFPFLVTEIDRKNNNIKGYRIREGRTPEYIVLDASLILNVECLTQANSPNFPWGLIPFLLMQIKND